MKTILTITIALLAIFCLVQFLCIKAIRYELSRKFNNARKSMLTSDCTYYVRASADGKGYSVYRRAYVFDHDSMKAPVYDTLIRHFDDDDPEYNRVCAEDLCVHINSKS